MTVKTPMTVITLTTEASDLGLKPGEWPRVLRLPHNIGDMATLEVLNHATMLDVKRDADGDVEHVTYVGFVVIKVLND